ncbi:hypothetical protein HPT27_04325 [Permianibacter sp. IMCC34836]|uniref:hypothetical protein n=1 Tax=Permianibacter fluminis TaxID=2738515 RepID=UPI0015572966|nr:hypothetical protein [Permianibacter fluminis]NQD36240.1 hypothetical protein [Permianibacter fluminis]
MRTLLFLIAGICLLAATLILAKLFSSNYPGAGRWLPIIAAALWFAIAAINMWTGIANAGYSFKEELPIFLLIAIVPVAMAALARWKFFPASGL